MLISYQLLNNCTRQDILSFSKMKIGIDDFNHCETQYSNHFPIYFNNQFQMTVEDL